MAQPVCVKQTPHVWHANFFFTWNKEITARTCIFYVCLRRSIKPIECIRAYTLNEWKKRTANEAHTVPVPTEPPESGLLTLFFIHNETKLLARGTQETERSHILLQSIEWMKLNTMYVKVLVVHCISYCI